jgi:hypothetical protein
MTINSKQSFICWCIRIFFSVFALVTQVPIMGMAQAEELSFWDLHKKTRAEQLVGKELDVERYLVMPTEDWPLTESDYKDARKNAKFAMWYQALQNRFMSEMKGLKRTVYAAENIAVLLTKHSISPLALPPKPLNAGFFGRIKLPGVPSFHRVVQKPNFVQYSFPGAYKSGVYTLSKGRLCLPPLVTRFFLLSRVHLCS